MIIYAVSKNSGPINQGSAFLVYLGTSIKEAEGTVGDFQKYSRVERKGEFPPVISRHNYSALPKEIGRDMIQFFEADGWWYSIEMFELGD